MDPFRRLSLILWAVALHSAAIGLSLILTTPERMQDYGFNPVRESFFPIQGGVFHIVMAFAYSLAAWRPSRYEGLVLFSIAAKFTALVFLLLYFFLVRQLGAILLSGAIDGLMALAILAAYRSCRGAKPPPA